MISARLLVVAILDVLPIWLLRESHMECDSFVNAHILDVLPVCCQRSEMGT